MKGVGIGFYNVGFNSKQLFQHFFIRFHRVVLKIKINDKYFYGTEFFYKLFSHMFL
jgi:hypothetical protein